MKNSSSSLGKALDSVQIYQKKQKAAERREKYRHRARETAAWRKEQEQLSTKITLSEEVFAWAERFSQKLEFKRLIRIADEIFISSINGGISGSCWIFSGRWGHKIQDDYGTWSRLYLSKEGKLFYSSGYKWMTPGPHFIIQDPTDMAERLTMKYIRTVRNLMRNGSVCKKLTADFRVEHEYDIELCDVGTISILKETQKASQWK